MNTTRLETIDIFRGAFFMCMGSDLTEIRIRNNGKRIATFLFTGADLNRLDKDYMNGTALVNPVQFRESLNRLRDIMIEKLRTHDPASSRPRRDEAATRGRMRNDRERNDRVHQVRR
ncbi:MAG: hypothetical protein R6U40_10415 [Desulfobacterales bacterium]